MAEKIQQGPRREAKSKAVPPQRREKPQPKLERPSKSKVTAADSAEQKGASGADNREG